jgi:diadenosine tetraphosphate (Ap4A) HIT family hydrolase
MTRTWPKDWDARMRGDGCPMCAQGRADENGFGVRFLAGRYADASLQRDDVQPGYSVVVWHGRHVSEPTGLEPEESMGFWLDVTKAARAIEAHFRPAKLNVMILGNAVPHLHAHVMPRFVDDPFPERPFEFPPMRRPRIAEDVFAGQVAALRALTGYSSATRAGL